MISILSLKMYFSYNQHAFIFSITIITVNKIFKKHTNYDKTSPNDTFWAHDPACQVIIYIENLNTDNHRGSLSPLSLVLDSECLGIQVFGYLSLSTDYPSYPVYGFSRMMYMTILSNVAHSRDPVDAIPGYGSWVMNKTQKRKRIIEGRVSWRWQCGQHTNITIW